MHTIDLHFLGVKGAIAAYCIPTDNGAILIECGPHSTTQNLLAGLAQYQLQPTDIKAVLLTHIHFDHAGAAWWWAKQGAQIYVHPRGFKHLQDPSKLYSSAKRIYGNQMERLWGTMEAIDGDRLRSVEDYEAIEVDGLSFQAHHTPGHATHHIAWQLGDLLFTGDVGGVKIQGGPVVPPCPPPDIQLAEWQTSLDRIRSIGPRRLYLTHFGPVENIEDHLKELVTRIEKYASWVKPYAKAGTSVVDIQSAFVDFVEGEFKELALEGHIIDAYRAANPPDMSLTGLMRYWLKYGLNAD
ncbi:MAG: MBL fold metallo-hydrolase [Bacteroidota bacterium]